jgi:hypothetical protein
MEKIIGKKHNLMCTEDMGETDCSTYLGWFPVILLLFLLLLQVA